MDNNLSVTFMKRLEYARKIAGYNTQESFADAYDEKYNSDGKKSVLGSVKKWERGAAIPKADSLLNICELLNCSADYLLGKQDTMKNDNIDAVKRTGLSEVVINSLNSQINSDSLNISSLISRMIEKKHLLESIISATLSNYKTGYYENIIQSQPPMYITAETLYNAEKNAVFMELMKFIDAVRKENGLSLIEDTSTKVSKK